MDAGIKNELLNHALARYYSIKRNIAGKNIAVNFNEFSDIPNKILFEEIVSQKINPIKKLEDSLKVVSWNIATGDEFDKVFQYLKNADADLLLL